MNGMNLRCALPGTRQPIGSPTHLIPRLALPLAALAMVAALFLFMGGLAAHAQSPNLTLTMETGLPAGHVVRPGEPVTFTLSLAYTGDTNPVQARISDTLPGGVALAGPPIIGEQAPQTVEPLAVRVQGEIVGWQGGLRPNATLQIQIPVRVERCWGGTRTLTNRATVLRPDGTTVQASAQLSVQCPLADLSDIAVHQRIVRRGQPAWMPYQPGLLPGQGLTLRTTFRNDSPVSVLLGVGTPRPADVTVSLAAAAGQEASALSQRIQYLPLQPGEEGSVEHTLQAGARLLGVSLLDGDIALQVSLVYCLLAGGERHCTQTGDVVQAEVQAADCAADDGMHLRIPCPDPGTIPPGTGQVTITIPVHPNDLGDAPDSSNHAGMAMEAYPNVQANFPTVFAPAPGSPPGPLHRFPLPVHLGANVSMEAEADGGPDADPTNNLLPAQGVSNRDRFDDGVLPGRVRLSHCQPVALRVQVTMQSAAVQQALLTRGIQRLYLNAWVDGNRDGDWNDTAPCGTGGSTAQEHILVDYPVNVGQLTPGPNPISILGSVPALWPDALKGQPAWLRVTLSEEKSPKLPGKSYGDGRGPSRGYRLGETEDQILRPQNRPDMSVEQEGHWTWQPDWSAADPLAGGRLVQFRITYGNQGGQTARDVILTQTVQEFGGRQAELALVQAPNLPAGAIQKKDGQISFDIGVLAPGEAGSIVVGWRVAGGGAATAAAGNRYTVQVVAESADDADPTNSQATTTVEAADAQPIFAFRAQGSPVPVPQGITCRDSVELVGQGEPGATLRIGLTSARSGQGDVSAYNAVGTVTAGADGRWSYTLNGLAAGLHVVQAQSDTGGAVRAALLVDSSLPLDPMSLTFSTPDHAFGVTWDVRNGRPLLWQLNLLPGQVYTVGVNGCGGEETSLALGAFGQTVDLVDGDGDGRYTGQLTAASQAGAQNLSLTARQGAVETAYAGSATLVSPGIVRDRVGGQPLANASVVLLAEQASTGPDGATLETGLDDRYGQPNPQTTGSDGGYFFAPPDGTYRAYVTHSGYQPYRTRSVAVDGQAIAGDIRLTPVVAGEPDLSLAVGDGGFSPRLLRVPPGTVVEWINVGLAEHTVTADNGAWDSGLLRAGEGYRLRLDAEGTFTYVDGLNPINTATVVVETGALPPGVQPLYLPVVSR